MIHILLTTLKVIGILLAIVLGLILALLIVVLFVPIRYKVSVKNTDVRAKVTWLLHLICVNVEYSDKIFKYKVRILFIPLNFNKKAKNDKSKVDKIKTKEIKADTSVETKNSSDSDSIKNTKEEAKDKPEAKKEPEKIEETLKQNVFDRLAEKFYKIKSKILGIYDKIISIKNKISIYKKFLTTKEAKENLKNILGMLFDFLKYILPTRLKGIVKFGFDSPQTTGKTLGVASMFYCVYGDSIELEPDFNNKVFEADIKFKGRIRMYRVLVIGFKLWTNKWIKKLIRFVKTH